MHSTVKHIGRLGLFILVLFLLLAILSALFLPDYSIRNWGRMNYEFSGIFGEPDNTIDVIFAGDSETFCAFSPMEIWKNQGFTTYLCSKDSQTLQDSYEYIRLALETQKPELVLLETFHFFREFDLETVLHSESRQWFPIIGNHDLWRKMDLQEENRKPGMRYVDDLKTYYISYQVSPASEEPYMLQTDEKEEIPYLNRWAFSRIVKLCQKENIQLALVSSPSPKNWSGEKHNAIRELAQQYDLPYLDLNLVTEEIGLDWTLHTRDEGDHLNHPGAVRTTEYLGRWLAEHYDLQDHRNCEGYESWDISLVNYERKVAEHVKFRAPMFRAAE